jgi:molybdate-binding protein/DNA-binding XRE family transcriptional regulator
MNLQQAELAQRCGVSRQFISMLESGRTQPNVQVALQLAAELNCTVEDLFSPVSTNTPQRVPVQLLQPQLSAGSRIDLALVAGRWVGHASDTVASLSNGFSESDAILDWKAGKASAAPHKPTADLEHNIAIAGCDPALALLRGSSGAPSLPGRCFWVSCGSARALQLLADGWVHAAGLHYSGEDADENLRHVRRFDPAGNWKVLHFTRWEQGWMIRPAARTQFKGLQDLANKRIRFVNREVGAGTRHWLDAQLSSAGLKSTNIRGYTSECSSHWECARALAENRADIAIGPRAVATVFGLEFQPTLEVAFDLVIPKAYLDQPRLQALLQRVRSRNFQKELETLAGYQAGAAGTER